MKIILLLLFLPLGILAQQPATSTRFSIKGQLTGLGEKELVSVTDANNPKDTLAKGTVTKGQLNLGGVVMEPNLCTINFHKKQKKVLVFLANESLQLKGSVDDVSKIEYAGSPVQYDFVEFQQLFNPLFQQLGAYSQRLQANPELNKNDTVMAAYEGLFNRTKTAIDSFTLVKKSSPLGAFAVLVTSELEQDIKAVEFRFARLDEEQKKGFYGRLIQKQIDEANFGAIGSRAVEFTQNDTLGKPVSLSSFKGKYVLVDFWASWCRPCRMENPNVVAAFNKFSSKNFTVLGVSLDRSKPDWLNAIKADGLTWTHVSDLKYWSNEVAQKYKVQSIPQNFLIGPDGTIVGKNLRGEELQSKLAELLGGN